MLYNDLVTQRKSQDNRFLSSLGYIYINELQRRKKNCCSFKYVE